jgi:hypothetical protein
MGLVFDKLKSKFICSSYENNYGAKLYLFFASKIPKIGYFAWRMKNDTYNSIKLGFVIFW